MTATESSPAHPPTTAEKLAELREKLELAKEPGGEKAAAKRDKKGIPSARARIHALVDPGSFFERGFIDAVIEPHETRLQPPSFLRACVSAWRHAADRVQNVHARVDPRLPIYLGRRADATTMLGCPASTTC